MIRPLFHEAKEKIRGLQRKDSESVDSKLKRSTNPREGIFADVRIVSYDFASHCQNL